MGLQPLRPRMERGRKDCRQTAGQVRELPITNWDKPTLTPEQRSEIAKNASAARWSKKKMRNRTTKRAKKGTESK
jgi:hypothetical protein